MVLVVVAWCVNYKWFGAGIRDTSGSSGTTGGQEDNQSLASMSASEVLHIPPVHTRKLLRSYSLLLKYFLHDNY